MTLHPIPSEFPYIWGKKFLISGGWGKIAKISNLQERIQSHWLLIVKEPFRLGFRSFTQKKFSYIKAPCSGRPWFRKKNNPCSIILLSQLKALRIRPNKGHGVSSKFPHWWQVHMHCTVYSKPNTKFTLTSHKNVDSLLYKENPSRRHDL